MEITVGYHTSTTWGTRIHTLWSCVLLAALGPLSTLKLDNGRFVAHLNSVFPSLDFTPELANRILTHGSHKSAVHGHNGRLGFIGRHRSPHDYDLVVSRALNTYLLGEHIAPRWSLGRVLRWVPTVSQDTLRVNQSVGLYKIMGEAVQAVVGGVYHQFGGSVAHRLFHTRILPHILLPERSSGVPAEFHAKALQICERMGGTEGDLISELPTTRVIESLETR
ncbi:hypothetical protein BU15DRAFT_87667 [Melanogaster broomeanus]|nr:hypothetical protein BU15DRAFT_87667 [Melanogaster broomeanus]